MSSRKRAPGRRPDILGYRQPNRSGPHWKVSDSCGDSPGVRGTRKASRAPCPFVHDTANADATGDAARLHHGEPERGGGLVCPKKPTVDCPRSSSTTSMGCREADLATVGQMPLRFRSTSNGCRSKERAGAGSLDLRPKSATTSAQRCGVHFYGQSTRGERHSCSCNNLPLTPGPSTCKVAQSQCRLGRPVVLIAASHDRAFAGANRTGRSWDEKGGGHLGT